MPADPFHVALYYNDLVAQETTISGITTAHMGIRQSHIMAGIHSPTEHPFLKAAFEGAKRLTAKNTSRNKKEPMTTDTLKLITDAYKDTENLLEIRFVVTCLISFSGFLRSDDLRVVQMKHITFHSDHMTILLPKAKNDQLRQSELVYVARLNSTSCPVRWIERYVRLAQLKDDDFLITPLRKTKGGHSADGRKALSYSRLRDDFYEHLNPVLGRPKRQPGEISLHSLRSGGASEAAAQNTSDRLIRKHGRWRADATRDIYIKDTKRNRLQVTRNLGL